MVNVFAIAAQGLQTVGNHTITVERRTGSRVNGAWIDDPPTTLTISGCSVTTASGNDLLRLDEGRRGNETLRIITPQELFSARALGSTNRSDVIVWNGRRYEVEASQNWGDAYWDVLAQRQGD